MDDSPVLVEIFRGDMVESAHRGRIAAVDAAGRIVLEAGDTSLPVYPRSGIKPLQAVPLVESGAADAFGLSDAEIAVACASHSGEPVHVETVSRWLTRIGLSAHDLECGAHYPLGDDAAREMMRRGQQPTALHNNCSGKHAGFLTLAKHMGVPTKGYIRPNHPVQQQVTRTLEELYEVPLADAPKGTDGCGIPVIGVPLRALAHAMARLADPRALADPRKEALRRIRGAMAAHPLLVAGHNRFSTEAMDATKGRIILKGGAEGIYCAAVHGAGLGIAVKIDDGARRAAEASIGAVLRRLRILTESEAAELRRWLEPPVTNWAGLTVGEIRAALP